MRQMSERLETLQTELESLRLRLLTMQVANDVAPPRSCEREGEVVFLAEVKSPQARALAHAREVAKAASCAALPSLLSRGTALGLNDEDIATALEFLQNRAPLCIHVSEQTVNLLATQSHYKCYHEVHGKNGGRDSVENWLYNNSYLDVAACEKLKYGALNVSNCAAGVLPASVCRYGPCWLELKDSLRCRVTLHYGDSLGQRGTSAIGTPESLAHVLSSHSDDELQSIVHVAKGGTAQVHPRKYTEVHFHGPLLLERDVQAVHVPTTVTALDAALKLMEERGIAVKRFKPLQGVQRGSVEDDY